MRVFSFNSDNRRSPLPEAHVDNEEQKLKYQEADLAKGGVSVPSSDQQQKLVDLHNELKRLKQ